MTKKKQYAGGLAVVVMAILIPDWKVDCCHQYLCSLLSMEEERGRWATEATTATIITVSPLLFLHCFGSRMSVVLQASFTLEPGMDKEGEVPVAPGAMRLWDSPASENSLPRLDAFAGHHHLYKACSTLVPL